MLGSACGVTPLPTRGAHLRPRAVPPSRTVLAGRSMRLLSRERALSATQSAGRRCGRTARAMSENADEDATEPAGEVAASEDDFSASEKIVVASGAISIPVVLWSEWVLKQTGCGLPPGPFGSLGALEGVSYLALVGIVGYSAFTKVKTGSGLPAGRFGLQGAVEGMAYLAFLLGIIVFVFQLLDFGFVPPPLPDGQCYAPDR